LTAAGELLHRDGPHTRSVLLQVSARAAALVEACPVGDREQCPAAVAFSFTPAAQSKLADRRGQRVRRPRWWAVNKTAAMPMDSTELCSVRSELSGGLLASAPPGLGGFAHADIRPARACPATSSKPSRCARIRAIDKRIHGPLRSKSITMRGRFAAWLIETQPPRPSGPRHDRAAQRRTS